MPLHRRKPGFVLWPLSQIYGFVVGVRNQLFNLKILKQTSFDIPVITIGNITVGGTGKTPHIEYLIKLLGNNFKIAVLSRGYQRKTKGFLLATRSSKACEIGDEPRQLKQKFPQIRLAVCKNRVEGIRKLVTAFPDLHAVLLDDGYQHRYVKPGLSILLIDYNQPIFNDRLLPYGNLRERESEIRRAQIVIVTKTPERIKPIEKKIFIKDLHLYPYQFLYFTTFSYSNPVPLFKHAVQQKIDYEHLKKHHFSIILVTGIANSHPLTSFLKKYTAKIDHIRYSDHHYYSVKDFESITRRFMKTGSRHKIILTTEKDAVKIKELKPKDDNLKRNLFYIFMDNGSKRFNKDIMDYIGKDKEVNRLHN